MKGFCPKSHECNTFGAGSRSGEGVFAPEERHLYSLLRPHSSLRRSDIFIAPTNPCSTKPSTRQGISPSGASHLVALKWSMKHIYGVEPGEVFWAASDLGWTVGHSYIVYGPLLHGNTTVLYEGKPVGTPDPGSFWRVISQHHVSVLFTAATAFLREWISSNFPIHNFKPHDRIAHQAQSSACFIHKVFLKRLGCAMFRCLLKKSWRNFAILNSF